MRGRHPSMREARVDRRPTRPVVAQARDRRRGFCRAQEHSFPGVVDVPAADLGPNSPARTAGPTSFGSATSASYASKHPRAGSTPVTLTGNRCPCYPPAMIRGEIQLRCGTDPALGVSDRGSVLAWVTLACALGVGSACGGGDAGTGTRAVTGGADTANATGGVHAAGAAGAGASGAVGGAALAGAAGRVGRGGVTGGAGATGARGGAHAAGGESAGGVGGAHLPGGGEKAGGAFANGGQTTESCRTTSDCPPPAEAGEPCVSYATMCNGGVCSYIIITSPCSQSGGTGGQVGVCEDAAQDATESAIEALLSEPEYSACSEGGNARAPSEECAFQGEELLDGLARAGLCVAQLSLRTETDPVALLAAAEEAGGHLDCDLRCGYAPGVAECLHGDSTEVPWCVAGACSAQVVCPCVDGALVEPHRECDGVPDCPDGSDEDC